MNKRILASLSAFSLLALLGVQMAWASQHTFVVNDEGGRDNVTFTSDAPVELIQGHTNQINGTIKYDDSFHFDAGHPFEIQFKVNLASLDTGIPLRNEHMRDNFLQTAKYPDATFKAVKIVTNAKPPFKTGQVVSITATGPFTLHGVTVSKTIPLKVTYFKESATTHSRFPAGNMIRIQGTFPVSLKAHNIPRPEVVFLKLAENVQVSLDVFGTDKPAAKSIEGQAAK